MSYNFAADSFHTNKLCSILSSSEVHFLYGNDKIVAFEAPLSIFTAIRTACSAPLYMPRSCPSVRPSVLRHIPVFCPDE